MSSSFKQGPFFHVVYFWLKNSKSQEDTIKLHNELNKFLAENKQVLTSHVGSPVESERDVVDSSYDLSLIVTFKSKEDQDIYQDDPTHLKFIENASYLCDKVKVYDSMEFS